MTGSDHTPVPLLSIIIVNYNSGELLKKCIASLYCYLDTGYEVIVYDNASRDESLLYLEDLVKLHTSINIIRGSENLGFAKANNLAAKNASGKFLHFLNPDIIVNKTLSDDYKLILRASESSIYVTSLTDTNGNPQKNKHLIPRIGNIARYIIGSPNVGYWNLGASIIIQAEAFRRMGGWPEDYFMYAEDLDFFYTAHKFKIPVKYISTSLVHIGKGVTRKIWNDEQRATIIEKSFKSFYHKYHAGWEYLIIRPVQLCYLLLNEPRSFPLYAKVFFNSLLKK